MERLTLKLIAANAEYYSDDEPESMSPTTLSMDCDPDETLFTVLKRADVPHTESRLWTDYFETPSMPLWVLPSEYVRHAGRLRSDSLGTCLLHPDLTVREFLDYFGTHATNRANLAVFPAAAIGGDPLDILVVIGGGVQDYFAARTPWDVVEDALTLYGGAGVVRLAQKAIADRRLRKLRRDGRVWLHRSILTRRLAQFVDSKQNWKCHTLATILGLDDLSTGRILSARGFSVSIEDFSTWTRNIGENHSHRRNR
ncbi:hypothetical protein LFM56_14740 [Cellulomonas iranensis]|uniref:hypothetical protein n=1 Tax=Cellulomonas iranensis TaxID=76862 RepID=UPI001CF3FBE4|nr:hypothetical protein [Cellulomonas iranensis]UCN14133.1 hypothetical protein LFM56_14740 [Cellulomonas iranensis]